MVTAGLTNHFNCPIILIVSLFIQNICYAGSGNIDGIGNVDLKDVIIALQVSAGSQFTVDINADVDKDDKIGPAEAIYALQITQPVYNIGGNLIYEHTMATQAVYEIR